jgi:hypothetical protein
MNVYVSHRRDAIGSQPRAHFPPTYATWDITGPRAIGHSFGWAAAQRGCDLCKELFLLGVIYLFI